MKQCQFYNDETGRCKVSDEICRTGIWEKENCTHCGEDKLGVK